MDIEVASIKPVSLPSGLSAGAQWSLASLAIGSMIFVASPILLAFNTIFANGGRYGVPMGLAWTASMIGWSALLILALVSVGFGVYGWTQCRRYGDCVAFGVAGTVMSIAAALGWLIAGIDLIMVLASFS